MCLATIRVHRIHSVLQIIYRCMMYSDDGINDRGINDNVIVWLLEFKYQYYPVWPFLLFDVRKLISAILNK